MKSYLKEIDLEFSGNFVGFLCKFQFASPFFEKRLHYCTTIALQKSCDKPANRRAASDEKPTPDVVFITILLFSLSYTCPLHSYALAPYLFYAYRFSFNSVLSKLNQILIGLLLFSYYRKLYTCTYRGLVG